MPEERDIEKSLRAWAKRRRKDAGAPLDLHPATRKLLQDEVARLKSAPRREPGRFARLLWGSPLRLALNLSAIAVLIFAAAVFLPQLRHAPSTLSGNPIALAENKRLPVQNGRPMIAESDNPGGTPPTPTVEAAPAIAAPQPLPQVAMRKAKSVTNTVALADNVTVYKTPVTSAASAAPGVAPPVPTSAPLSLDAEKSATRQFANSDLTVAPANEPASVVANSANRLAPAAVVVQKLVWINSPLNADRRDGVITKLGAPALLTSFRTEQSGDQLRVIDADGSVYAGNLTASTEILDSNGAFPAARTRAFRLTGTNLTLRQPVVFTGNLIFADQSALHGKKDVSGAIAVSGGFVNGAGGGGFGGVGGLGGAGINRAVAKTNPAPVPGAAAGTAVIAGATPIPGSVAQTTFAAGALPPQLPSPPQFRVEGTVLVGTNAIQINAVSVPP